MFPNFNLGFDRLSYMYFQLFYPLVSYSVYIHRSLENKWYTWFCDLEIVSKIIKYWLRFSVRRLILVLIQSWFHSFRVLAQTKHFSPKAAFHFLGSSLSLSDIMFNILIHEAFYKYVVLMIDEHCIKSDSIILQMK